MRSGTHTLPVWDLRMDLFNDFRFRGSVTGSEDSKHSLGRRARIRTEMCKQLNRTALMNLRQTSGLCIFWLHGVTNETVLERKGSVTSSAMTYCPQNRDVIYNYLPPTHAVSKPNSSESLGVKETYDNNVFHPHAFRENIMLGSATCAEDSRRHKYG